MIKLVLTLVELIRKLIERQAIRRMETRTLTAAEAEAVGAALMEIERNLNLSPFVIRHLFVRTDE